jgi:hypothetical protein
MPVFVPESDPAAASWRTLMMVNAQIAAATAANTMILGFNNWATSGSNTTGVIPTFNFDPTHYAVTNRTTRLRLLATLMTNATAPAANFTFGFYPISSVAGAAGGISHTVGTVVSGSTVLFTAPTASTRNNGISTSFSAPTANYHGIGLVLSAATAASSYAMLTAILQIQNV